MKDDGTTLIELLVSMSIFAIIGMIVLLGVTNVTQVFLRDKEESQGLADAKIVLDRVTRDIREANQITCDGVMPGGGTDTNCELHLELWSDQNGDYVGPPNGASDWLQPNEKITWYVSPSGDWVHCDVYRKEGNGVAQKIAASLVIDGAQTCRTFFEYDNSFDNGGPSMVTFKMYYDPRVGEGIEERLATTQANVRNVR